MKKSLLLIFLLWGTLLFAQNRTTPYKFPVQPGTAEWKKLQSRTEMATVTTIPADILKDLTTEALAKTCLQFPLFKDLYFFDNIQQGFDGLKKSFNGFTELLQRKDAGVELYKIYVSMNPDGLTGLKSDTEKGEYTFQFVQIEMILAQDEIITSLSADVKDRLLKEAARKYDLKKPTGEFSNLTLSPSILIIGRILDKENKLQKLKAEFPDNSVQNFLSTGQVGNSDILERIKSNL